MNSKGFTLIEILSVIVILGLLGTIVTVTLTTTLNNTMQNDCDAFVLEVEDAACVYVGLSNKEIVCTRDNCPPIPLSILVENGLITSETDACTGSDINSAQTVTVTWDEASGEKSCTYNGVKVYER